MNKDLSEMKADVWETLERAVSNGDPRREIVLATRALSGGANARTVILRAVDPHAGNVHIHTDTAMQKCRELAVDPGATIVLWDRDAAFQIRLSCVVTIRPGTAAEWLRVPDLSQSAYGRSPPPGSAILAPGDHVSVPDPERFAVLVCQVTAIDALYIWADGHIRAIFEATDGFEGRWIAP